jgi:hypothetical protein
VGPLAVRLELAGRGPIPPSRRRPRCGRRATCRGECLAYHEAKAHHGHRGARRPRRHPRIRRTTPLGSARSSSTSGAVSPPTRSGMRTPSTPGQVGGPAGPRTRRFLTETLLLGVCALWAASEACCTRPRASRRSEPTSNGSRGQEPAPARAECGNRSKTPRVEWCASAVVRQRGAAGGC